MTLSLLVLGTTEIVLIVVAVGLLFGATRIPALMKGMGQGIREFKGAMKEDDDVAAKAAQSAPPGPPAAANTGPPIETPAGSSDPAEPKRPG